MSTQIDLGPVLSVPRGDWNAATVYERLNIVRHNSASWICNVATSQGVEPTEGSTDWYLQVKDTSAVSSVNGMKGDVVIELTETETPPVDDSSTRIATTEWVNSKNTALETNLQSYVQEAIEEAEDSISQNANNNINAVIGNYLPLQGGTLTGWLTGVRYIQKMPDVDVSATPTSSLYGQPIIFTDKNNQEFAAIQPTQWNNGSNTLRFIVSAKDGTQGSILTMEEKVDGTTLLTLNGDHIITAAGTGLSQSTNKLSLATVVTAGNAGPTANASPAAGGTFTVPYITYDAYGRVTGRTNRTITLPAAPTSVTTATKAGAVTNITSAVKVSATSATTSKQGSCTVSTTSRQEDGDKIYSMTVTLPSGGNWHWIKSGVSATTWSTGRSAGGTAISVGDVGMLLAVRYA